MSVASAGEGVFVTAADEVILTIPGTPDYLRLARLAASDSGARAGLSYEDIDDLRIAVDELCFVVMAEGNPTPLVLNYRVDAGNVEVSGFCDSPNGAPIEPNELARAIIGAVVDEYEVSGDATGRRFRLVKSATQE